jgi:hypothetical protein
MVQSFFTFYTWIALKKPTAAPAGPPILSGNFLASPESLPIFEPKISHHDDGFGGGGFVVGSIFPHC